MPACQYHANAGMHRSLPKVWAGCSALRSRCALHKGFCHNFRESAVRQLALQQQQSGAHERRLRRLPIPHASWGSDIQWEKASIASNTQAAKGLHSLAVDIGSEAAQRYQKAGQYMQLRVDGSKPGFFAIASAPAASLGGTVELLIKCKGETAELLCSSNSGLEVEVSPVGGKGFPIERAPAHKCPHLLIFATGSGISPVRALIDSGTLEAHRRRSVRLYYGTYDEEQTAYQADKKRWEQEGIEVVSVFSSQGSGYVQDVFAKEANAAEGSSTGAILCGHKEMAIAVTELLTKQGVDKDLILTNF